MADMKTGVGLDYKGLEQRLEEIGRNFQGEGYGLGRLLGKHRPFRKPGMGSAEGMETLIRSAAELTPRETPLWEFAAARLRHCGFTCEVEKRLKELGVKGLYEKISYLTEQGLYGDYILKHYSREEIEEAEGFPDDGGNKLFAYAGLDLLPKRYVIQDHSHHPLETSQEMYLSISLHLAIKESKDCRVQWVHRFCDMLSRMQVIMATPTLSSVRKPYHQLSSCFIDTVPDSLEGIYRSVDNFAQASKFSEGMGLYFGKIRAAGNRIRGFEGTAGGVIRWIKLANDTAMVVDQLGMRQDAAAVYLDAQYKDLPELLQPHTNNGDDRMKAYDIFPAMCFPDLFWKMAEESLNQDWYLMCPHEIRAVEGYCMEDCYRKLWKEQYLDRMGGDRISKRTVLLRDMVRLIVKSTVETGTPLIFSRGVVNRANPNSHRGIIYCSNLCTEITQNMSPIEGVSTQALRVNGEATAVQTARPGDFVIYNLASLRLGTVGVDDPDEVEYIAVSAVRALDNMIDLNSYPLTYAGITNQNYKGVGLGVSGYRHVLAKHGIRWESKEYLVFADQTFKRIHYAAIRVSANLAAEKRRYRYFEGSE